MEPWEGAGRIAGKTRVEGIDTAGITVEALHRPTGRIVKIVTSDSTGSFEISGLNSMHVFDVIARPPGKNAVISDSRKPVSDGVYYSKWDSERRNTTYTSVDSSKLVAGAYNSYFVGSEIAVSSGKWYWEIQFTVAGSQRAGYIGVARPTATMWENGTSWGYYGYNGTKYGDVPGGSAYGPTYDAGDVISVILDLDSGVLAYRKNGTDIGTAFTGLTGSFVACVTGGSSGTPMAQFTANFGESGFLYPPPSGFNPGLYLM